MLGFGPESSRAFSTLLDAIVPPVVVDTHDGWAKRSRRQRRIAALQRRTEEERLADVRALRVSLEAAFGLAVEISPEDAQKNDQKIATLAAAVEPASIDWQRVAEDEAEYLRLSRAVARLSEMVQAKVMRRAEEDDEDETFLLGVV